MAINTINGVNYGTSVLNQSVTNIKNQLTVLQAQLTTGTKSTTYAGMGVNEGFAIAIEHYVLGGGKRKDAGNEGGPGA